MTFNSIIREWDNLTDARKQVALDSFIRCLKRMDNYELFEIFLKMAEMEQEDFFGTEGANL